MPVPTIPLVLFHATPTENFDSIVESGLLGGLSERANFPGFEKDVLGCVFLADKKADADYFGRMAGVMSRVERGKKLGRGPDYVVLTVNTFRAKLAGVKVVEPEGKLERPLFKGRQFMACGNIPREAIVAAEHVTLDPESGKLQREEMIPWVPLSEQSDWRR